MAGPWLSRQKSSGVPTMRRVLFWLVRNVPLGRAAPWVLGLALGSKPQRVRPAANRRIIP